MGILSDIQRFHSAGQGPSETDVSKYGRPACTLSTELNPGDLHQKIEIKDEQGQTLYYTKSSVFALKGSGAESIGSGQLSTCGTVTIEDPSKVTKN